MPLDTNFNVTPFFDDYTENSKYYRILFRPGVPVQTRELNQLSTILQNQIERFGQNIYKNGTILKGCSFSYDSKINYAKFNDNREDGQQFNPLAHLPGSFISNGNNLIAQVYLTSSGLESQDPDLNTVYFHYLTTGTNGETDFTNSELINFYSETTNIDSITIVSGGSGYSVGDTLTIASDTGTNATASVSSINSTGSITAITIDSPGSGFTVRSTPNILITTAGGTNANLTATYAYNAQVRISDNSFANSIGKSHSTAVTDGVIFQKGHFIGVDTQRVITSKYTNTPDNISIGFVTSESVVNNSIDTSLHDNANGFPNSNAPGAYRLQLNPNLVSLATAEAEANTEFFTLVRFEGGLPVTTNQRPQFNAIGDSLARRTAEESGNYVIETIPMNSEAISANTTHRNIVTGAGVAYVSGKRVEIGAPRRTPIKVSDTFVQTSDSALSQNFGNYIRVNELVGDFFFAEYDTVLLCNTAFSSITSGSINNDATPHLPTFNNNLLSHTGASSTAITGEILGRARMRTVTHSGGIQGTGDAIYNIYLFDIQMNTGKDFKNVRSIYHYAGALSGFETNNQHGGIADIILNNNVATVNESVNKTLIFPIGPKAIKRMRTDAVTDTVFKFRTATQSSTIDRTSGRLSISISSGNNSIYATGTVPTGRENDFVVIPQEAAVGQPISTGTAIVSNNSSVIAGSNFDTLLEGDYIRLTKGSNTSIKRIVAVESNTHITVTPSFDTTESDVAGQILPNDFRRYFPAYLPVDLTQRDATNIQIVSNGSDQSIDINIGTTLVSNTSCSVYYNAQKNNAEHVRKIIERVELVVAVSGVYQSRPIPLGVPDVFEIESVHVGGSIAFTPTSSNEISDNFQLITGQTDSHYGLSRLAIVPGKTPFTGHTQAHLRVVFRCFRPNTSGGGFGFFNVESYPVNDAVASDTTITTQEIPVFTSPVDSKTYDLRNCVDFRPHVANTANYTFGATNTITAGLIQFEQELFVGNQHVPAPNEAMIASLEYYQERIDKLALAGDGKIEIIEGESAEIPSPPPDKNASMTLGTINIPPYPSLDAPTSIIDRRPDYAIRLSQSQVKRFTMSDINQINERLTRLEYYTSLNLLEKQASDLTLPSTSNASLNRFKNGIVVDNFNSLLVADTQSPEFKAGLDTARNVLIPKFIQTDIQLEIESLTNGKQTTDVVTLDYDHEQLLSNPRATTTRVCAGAYWKYYGDIKILPNYDNHFETTTNPIPSVNIDVDTATPVLALVDELNTILPSIVTASRVISESENTQLLGTTIDGNSETQTFETVTETIREQSSQLVTGTSSATNVQRVGDFVTNVGFIPFIRAQIIHFHVVGLRPNLQHHVFFDEQLVDELVQPAIVSADEIVNKNNFQSVGVFGATLTSDACGEIFGILHLPANRFFVGDRKLVVANVATYNRVDTSISISSGFFRAFNFNQEKTGLTVSSRAPELSRQTITERIVEQDTTTHTATTISETTVASNFDGRRAPVSVRSATTESPTEFAEDVFDWSNFRLPEFTFDLGFGEGGFNFDPLAQTFQILASSASGIQEGVFVTKLDVFFSNKDILHGITLELREVINGFPGPSIIPFGRKHLRSIDVNVSDNGTSITEFYFDSPIFLKANREYCFVLMPDGNSPDYSAYVSRTGDADLTTGEISNNDWGAGVLFLSTNNTTWEPILDEDIKFNLHIARYKSGTGTFKVVNKNDEYFTLDERIPATVNVGQDILQTIGNVHPGTLAFNSSSSQIIGSGTNFSLLVNGEKIFLIDSTSTKFDLVEIVNIISATELTVKGYPKFTNTAGRYNKTVSGTIKAIFGNQCIVSDSTASTAAQFNSGAAVGIISNGTLIHNTTIQSINDYVVSNFEPQISRSTVQGTNVDFRMRGVVRTGHTRSPNHEYGDTIRYKFNDKNFPGANVNIMSRSNEITQFSGNKSLEGWFDASSISRKVSPTVDTQNISLLSYENIINNDPFNEYLPNAGAAFAKYVSKTVVLENSLDAEDFLVYVTGYQPAGTEIKVYARLLDEQDNTRFIDKHWTEMVLSEESNQLSSTNDPFDFREYVFNLPTIPKFDNTNYEGTVNIAANSNQVIGTGTQFDTLNYAGRIVEGDIVLIRNEDDPTAYFVSAVVSTNTNTLFVVSDSSKTAITDGKYYKVSTESLQQSFLDRNGTPTNISTYYSQSKQKFTGYKTFALKIVLLSDNKYLVPKIKDYRALSVSV